MTYFDDYDEVDDAIVGEFDEDYTWDEEDEPSYEELRSRFIRSLEVMLNALDEYAEFTNEDFSDLEVVASRHYDVLTTLDDDE